jgi:hypothetical protein
VANRDEDHQVEDVSKDPKGTFDRLTSGVRRDGVEFNQLDIRLRVSYKTLLLIFVLFDVFHKIVNGDFVADTLRDILGV